MNTGIIIMSTASKTKAMSTYQNYISEVIELQIVFDDVAIDSSKVDLKTLFAKVSESGKIPQTSQPTPYAFEQAINDAFEQFDNLVIITPHSQISGTYQNCVNVASEHSKASNIFVIEVNGGIAVTEAMLIDYCLEQISANTPFDKLKDELTEYNKRLLVHTFPGDIAYLKVSGRVSGAAALLLSALNIRVVVKMEGGTPIIASKGRGDKSVLKYVNNILKEENIEKIYYTSLYDDPKMREQVLKLFDENNIKYEVTAEANSVPAAHLGPNNFGVGVLLKN